MIFLGLNFDTWMRWIILPIGLILFLLLFNWLGIRRQNRLTEEAIKDGRLKVLSHAEYNRMFGIENTLKLVESDVDSNQGSLN